MPGPSCIAFRLFLLVTLARQGRALLAGGADNVRVRPWGENALRIQVAPADWELTDALPTAYLPGGAPGGGYFSFSATAAPGLAAGPVTSGNIRATQVSRV